MDHQSHSHTHACIQVFTRIDAHVYMGCNTNTEMQYRRHAQLSTGSYACIYIHVLRDGEMYVYSYTCRKKHKKTSLNFPTHVACIYDQTFPHELILYPCPVPDDPFFFLNLMVITKLYLFLGDHFPCFFFVIDPERIRLNDRTTPVFYSVCHSARGQMDRRT